MLQIVLNIKYNVPCRLNSASSVTPVETDYYFVRLNHSSKIYPLLINKRTCEKRNTDVRFLHFCNSHNRTQRIDNAVFSLLYGINSEIIFRGVSSSNDQSCNSFLCWYFVQIMYVRDRVEIWQLINWWQHILFPATPLRAYIWLYTLRAFDKRIRIQDGP
jgi:hypothetical protein